MTQTPHKTKTKGHSRTPQKTPGKVSLPNKKKKPDSRLPDKPLKPPADKSSAFAVGEAKGKDNRKPPKNSQGKGKR